MSAVSQRYALPPEIDRFIDDVFLEMLAERPEEMTVEFHIPAMLKIDHRRRITAYSIVWIHPEHNAEFCHSYLETPGDLPNFFVEVTNPEGPSEVLDDLVTVDDLEAWLEDLQLISDHP